MTKSVIWKRMKIINFIENNVSIVLLMGVPLGLIFPYFGFLKWSLKYILMFVLFVSFLKIDFKEILNYLKNPIIPAYGTLMNMFLAPVIIFLIFSLFMKDYNFIAAVLLLSAVPSGVASAAMTELTEGDASLTVIITIFSHFVAPVSIPLLFFLLLRKIVRLDYVGIFITMLELIIVPLILAVLFERFFKKQTAFFVRRSKSITAIPISFISLIVLSINAKFIYTHPVEVLKYLALIYPIYFFFFAFGLLYVPFLDNKKRIAVSNSKTFMNVSIGIVLAMQFFNPQTALIITLAQIPWPTMLGPVNFLMKKLKLK